MKRSRGKPSSSSPSEVKHEGDFTTHVVPPLLFSSKASGLTSRQRGPEPPQPVQIIRPVGSFGVGLPLFTKRNRQEDIDRFNMNTVIISGPENEEIDQQKSNLLISTFFLIGILNIFFTCLLFLVPNSMDISKVLPNSAENANQLAFVEISSERSGAENTLFYATLANLCLGIVSALLKQPLGLACYVLIMLLTFFLGFTAIPYFFYVTRYALDAYLGYVALVLKSRLTVNFLKVD